MRPSGAENGKTNKNVWKKPLSAVLSLREKWWKEMVNYLLNGTELSVVGVAIPLCNTTVKM